MSIQSELTKTANNTIADFGYSLTLSRVSGSSYSSATGTNTETITTYTVTGLITHYTRDEVNGVTILSDDRKAIIKSGVITPQVNDRLTGVGNTMRIVEVVSVAPTASSDMFYVCTVRA
jgi:hypothetical protein